MLFTSVFVVTLGMSLTISCLVYLLVWIAFPEVQKYRNLSLLIIIGLSIVLNVHYSKQDYNPGHHYKTVAEYLHE